MDRQFGTDRSKKNPADRRQKEISASTRQFLTKRGNRNSTSAALIIEGVP